MARALTVLQNATRAAGRSLRSGLGIILRTVAHRGRRLLWILAAIIMSCAIAIGAKAWLARTPDRNVDWEALTAIGTLSASMVAVTLAISGWLRSRKGGARLVSAWITEAYEPVVDADHYRRRVTLHVANEGDEPAYEVKVSVLYGSTGVELGPLSAPAIIAVLPPRRELNYDLSIAMLAHENSWHLRGSVTFRDPQGRRWHRDGTGVLHRASRSARWNSGIQDDHLAQLGRESLQNPLLLAIAFLEAVRTAKQPEDFVAPEAEGWQRVDWENLREEIANYQPTSMVAYPAPYIAQVKLVGDPKLHGKVAVGDSLRLDPETLMFLTLTYAPMRGWRVFSIGGTIAPEEIKFPRGTFEVSWDGAVFE